MARKEKLIAMLEEDPDDPFLHYALATEELSAGETAAGRDRLRGVIARFPEYHAAHFQLARTLAEAGETADAAEILKAGIEAARRQNDGHAVGEMTGYLETLE